MPTKNKNIYKSRRQSSRIDNKSRKFVVGASYNSSLPLKVSRQDSTITKRNMIVPLTEGLRSLRGGIIENSIKYIMLSLYLLHFYIFGVIFLLSVESNEHADAKHIELCDDNYGKRNQEKQIKMECREQRTTNESSDSSSSIDQNCCNTSYLENDTRNMSSPNAYYDMKNDSDKPNDETVIAEKNSDSFQDQYQSSASNVTAMNMPLMNYKNIDSLMTCTTLEEPMDVSVQKHNFNKKQSLINMSRDTKSSADVQSNVIRSKSSRSYTDKRDSNFSVDEEIAEIFKEQCIFSKDAYSSSSFPKSFAFYKYKRSKQSNFFYRKENSKGFNNSLIRPWSKKNKTEQKKKLSIKFVPIDKNEKLTFDEEENEKHTGRENEKKTQEEERNSLQDDPTKYKSYSLNIPVRNKESEQNNVKYEGTAMQTDSTFSTDNDVEIIPAEIKWPGQQFYRCATSISRDRNMDQELNYIAENGKSEDKFLRISSCSTSSSSTDLDFDEHASAIPDTDIAADQWLTNLSNSISIFRKCTRSPPGFPEVPQYPPLTCNPEHFIPPSSNDDHDHFPIASVAVIPPAPPPMRHLYYDYPEFMDLPTHVNSLYISDNILNNNYY